MNKLSRQFRSGLWLVALFAVLCWPQASFADEWSGTLKRKGKPKENIAVLVKYTDEGPEMKKLIYAGSPLKLNNQDFSDETLSFTWKSGEKDVVCVLKNKKGSKYEGECKADGSDNIIEMQIVARDSEDEPEEDEEDSEEEKPDD